MKNLSLKTRMALTINSVIFIALTLLIFLQVRQTSQFAREQAFANGQELAHRYADQVSATLNDAMLTADTLAQTLEGMKLSWVDDRSLYNGLLSQVLRANTNFFAIWSVWEPDGLDGNDKKFVGKSGHDETGRFIPCWVRAVNDVQLDKLVDYSTPGAGDYYLLARNANRETLLEPRKVKYAGQQLVVATAAVPIRYNGSVVGVVGIDIPMQNLQTIVETIRPYETGSASLISESGQFIAHPEHDKIGTTLDDSITSQKIKEAVGAAQIFTGIVYAPGLNGDTYEVVVPVRAGNAQARWSLAVKLPMDKILAGATSIMYRATLFGLVTLFVMAFVVSWLSRSITSPLKRISDGLSAAAQEVQGASQQTQEASEMLAAGANEQAASLEETSSSLVEMSSVTQRNAQNAQKAKELAKQAREAAEKGVGDMREMNTAMEEIKVSSDDIAKIIKTIDEIAFQTNILALNAAVEAARAGEAGLGFAVVADEVRNLAQRSAQAAKETTDRIEGAIDKTAQGVGLSQKVAQRLNEIVVKARQVDELAAEVANASDDQTHGIGQINSAVSQVEKVMQSNVMNAEESAAAAQQLSVQATTMKQSVTELLNLVGGAQAKNDGLKLQHSESEGTNGNRLAGSSRISPSVKVHTFADN